MKYYKKLENVHWYLLTPGSNTIIAEGEIIENIALNELYDIIRCSPDCTIWFTHPFQNYLTGLLQFWKNIYKHFPDYVIANNEYIHLQKQDNGIEIPYYILNLNHLYFPYTLCQ